MKSITAIGVVMALMASLTMGQAKQEHAGAKAEKNAKVIAEQLPSYPLEICLVSEEPLEGMQGAQNVVVEGRLVRVCCKSCVRKVEANPMKYIEKVNAAVIKRQAPHYPLTKCPISGEALGSMGEPIKMVHGTRLVQVCCKGCVKGFKKNPAKTMAKLDEALIAQQRKTYPSDKCVVSGEKLEEGKAVDFLYGTKLVRVCCKGCVKKVKQHPRKYVAMAHGKGLKKGHEKGHGARDGHGEHKGKGHGKGAK